MEIKVDSNVNELAPLIGKMAEEIGYEFTNKVLKRALALVVKDLKKDIAAAPISKRLKKTAKQTAGYKLVLKKRDVNGIIVKVPVVAKVGLGVGKRKKPPPRTRSGVGVSKQNIHWFVLGTKERVTKTGKPRGKIEPMLSGIVGRRLSTLSEKIHQGMTDVLKQQIKSLESKNKKTR